MLKKLFNLIGIHSENVQNDVENITVEFGEPVDDDKYTGLRPANIIDAFMPLYVFLGKPVTILLNEKYDLGEMAEFPIQRTNALMILLIMEKLLPTGSYVGTVLISDGVTSHAISPLRVTQEESYRLYYRDPWGETSFLEAGKNLSGINARKELNEEFSISYGEYEQIIVAFGFAEVDPPAIFEALKQAHME